MPADPQMTRSDALVARLRAHDQGARQQCQCRTDQPNCIACDCGNAADEIERQDAELTFWRDGLTAAEEADNMKLWEQSR